MGKFSQHIVNNVCFQTINVIQRRSTNRKLHVDVLQNQLPNSSVFSCCTAIVLDGVTPSSASVARFYAKLIARTISSNSARQTTHRISQTQCNKGRVITSATTLAITACGQRRGFAQIRIVLRFIFKHFQFFFHTIVGFVELAQLFTHSTIYIAANSLGNFNNCGCLHGCNFGFQCSNFFSHFSLCSINSGNGFCFNSGNFFRLCGFNCVQFFNDYL